MLSRHSFGFWLIPCVEKSIMHLSTRQPTLGRVLTDEKQTFGTYKVIEFFPKVNSFRLSVSRIHIVFSLYLFYQCLNYVDELVVDKLCMIHLKDISPFWFFVIKKIQMMNKKLINSQYGFIINVCLFTKSIPLLKLKQNISS